MYKHFLVVLSLTALAATGSAEAASASKEETIGVGSGLVVGALAGGPVGAIIGAAIGAKLGDSFHEREEAIAALDAEVGSRDVSIAHLERNIRARDAEMARLQKLARPELVQLLAAGIEMDLLFRTDEHVLADDTGSRLTDLAGTLASLGDISVRIDGYSDERGDESYNQALSMKRAEHVRGLLVAAGMPVERIRVEAHGEATAADQTPDSFALERKVSLTVFIEAAPSLAANPGD